MSHYLGEQLLGVGTAKQRFGILVKHLEARFASRVPLGAPEQPIQ
jgi:hypothetical protein